MGGHLGRPDAAGTKKGEGRRGEGRGGEKINHLFVTPSIIINSGKAHQWMPKPWDKCFGENRIFAH